MDKYAFYEIWSPAASPWSPWVKPALFAYHPRPDRAGAPSPRDTQPFRWFPQTAGGCALIVDLEGPDSVRYGIELAHRGFRPVPTFASCPPDAPGIHPCPVDADAVLAALFSASAALSSVPLAVEAPPAFLLDASRNFLPVGFTGPEVFDNRSAIFASDFPSASTLRSHGIHRCLIIRDSAKPVGADLLHALLYWKRDGIEITAVGLDGSPLNLTWPRLGFWSDLWHRLRLRLSLGPNSRGGYGCFHDSSAGG